MTTKELITDRTVISFEEEPVDEAGKLYRLTLDNGLQLLVPTGWIWVFPKED